MSNTYSANSSDVSHPVVELIERVRQGGLDSLGELLDLYRQYLTALAASQVNGRLARRVNASDMVQETMLAAHRDFQSFRGGSEGELIAWLRQILSNSISHAVEKHLTAKKRDVRREVSLNDLAKGADGSMGNEAELLADCGVSPSEDFARRELAIELSVQLAKLKPDYRDVIVYRNLHGLSFDEIAEKMGRKSGTVRMLWLRAIAKFKETCGPIDL